MECDSIIYYEISCVTCWLTTHAIWFEPLKCLLRHTSSVLFYQQRQLLYLAGNDRISAEQFRKLTNSSEPFFFLTRRIPTSRDSDCSISKRHSVDWYVDGRYGACVSWSTLCGLRMYCSRVWWVVGVALRGRERRADIIRHRQIETQKWRSRERERHRDLQR